MLTRREMLARWAGVSAVLLLEGCNSLSDIPTAPTYHAASLLSTGTTYYVDPAGDDENSGTSPDEAWQTLQRVTEAGLKPGDVVLLQAGEEHTGAAFMPETLSGTAEQPVIFGRYGEGSNPVIRATEESGWRGLNFYNVGGVAVEDLDVIGPGNGFDSWSGVSFYTDQPGRRPAITVRRVRSSRWKSGISVGSWAGESGYDGIMIEDAVVEDNTVNGLSVYAEHLYKADQYFKPHRNMQIRRVRALRNAGRAGRNEGFGINVWGVMGGVIEDSEAHHNGAMGGRSDMGPFGIMVWASENVTIRRAYASHNKSAGVDGGGIDLDGDCINCTIEHCYTHDNMAAGYFLAAFSGSGEFSGNVLRYSVSENDGRKNTPRAGISVWRVSPLGSHINNRIYGNTVYFSRESSAVGAALELRSRTTDLRVVNNIFVTTGGARLLDSVGDHGGLRLDGNAYHAADGNHIYRFASVDHASLLALQEATGQEQNGTQEAPLLLGAGEGGAAPDGDLQAVSAYRLQPESRMPTAGLDLRAQGFTLPAADYYGNAIPLSGEFRAIGAATVAEKAPAPPEDPPPPPGNPQLHTLTESFSGGALDTSKWTTSLNRRGSLVVKDQLELNLSSGGTGWVTCNSVGAYALTGSHATVEVKQLGTQPALYTAFSLRASDDDLLAWAHEPSSGLLAVKSVGGEQIVRWSGLHNATTHRWWRIRESGGMVFWETSSDGAAWTTHHSEAASIPIAALQVSFHAERRAGTGSTQKVIFDNLNPA